MNDAIKESLVALVAEVDALFEPTRKQGDEPTFARLQTRRYFHESGLSYRRAGDSHARNRLLAEMEAAGLVTVTRKHGRATHWKPTDAGDQLARALAEQPGQAACLALMRKLKALADAGDYVPAGDGNSSFTESAWYVPEQILGGWDFDNKPAFLAAVQTQWETLAYAWPRRWITTAIYGPSGPLLLYALTAAGEAALASPPTIPKLPAPADVWFIHYTETFLAHAEAWKTAKRRDKHDLSFQPMFLTCQTANERKSKLSAGTTPTKNQTQKTGIAGKECEI